MRLVLAVDGVVVVVVVDKEVEREREIVTYFMTRESDSVEMT